MGPEHGPNLDQGRAQPGPGMGPTWTRHGPNLDLGHGMGPAPSDRDRGPGTVGPVPWAWDRGTGTVGPGPWAWDQDRGPAGAFSSNVK